MWNSLPQTVASCSTLDRLVLNDFNRTVNRYFSHHLMIVPAPPMHQYDDTPMMVSVLYWKKKTLRHALFLERHARFLCAKFCSVLFNKFCLYTVDTCRMLLIKSRQNSNGKKVYCDLLLFCQFVRIIMCISVYYAC